MTEPLTRLIALLADRYTIERELGAGGMATVFLARDLRHDRRVAIKVLRDDVAKRTGAERFLREIRTTANLQHPHIVPLFDSGEAGGTVYYVMPYVEGETLRDRLEREGQLAVSDAVRIAREVADALDYAHRHGVVHRDVKPENILLHEGRAMVADFGIALALARTMGDVRLTETGMSVGTPHYMSPEQATGEKHITARTDIFALGVILYEMLAGEPPFTGDSTQAIVAKMLTSAPTPVLTLRPMVPAHVAAAIDCALEKVAADRFATAGAFDRALQPPDGTAAVPKPSRPTDARPTARWWLAGATALLLAAVGGYLLGAPNAPTARTAPVARAVIPLAPDQLLAIDAYPLTISHDGKYIVYAGDDSGKVHLFLRALSDTASQPLPETDGATTPFFSPDDAWIGFFSHGALKKMPRTGGAPIVIALVPQGELGADWGTDGTILLAGGDGSLHRAYADGSPAHEIMPAPASSARRAAFGLLKFPSFLPGTDRALISTDSGIGVMDLTTGAIRTVSRGRQGRYLPTGQLLFDDNEGRIRVVPFDAERGAIAGTSVPVFEAFRGPGGGPGYFTVSQNGTLVYMPGGFQRRLVRVDRYGRETPINVQPRGYRFPAVSPDGRRIAVTVDPRPSEIWLIDPVLGQTVPLTSDGVHSILPIWSWDGTRIAFMRYQSGVPSMSWMLAQPGAERHVAFRRATQSHADFSARLWTRGDDMIGNLYAARPGQVSADIARAHVGDTTLNLLVASPTDDREPALSPDGKWLAYTSDISGANEIYVRPYSDSGAAILVSAHGGVEAHWSANGTEVVYRSGTRLMSVSVRTQPDFAALRAPQVLFSGPFDFSQSNNWSPSPDGSFIMIKADPTMARQLRVVFNWFDEVKTLGTK